MCLSDDLLHAVIDEIGHPVVLMKTDGGVLQENAAARKVMHGGPGGVPAGPYFCPFLHENDGTPTAGSFIGTVIQTGQRREREIYRFGRWWRIHLVPVRNQRHEVHYLLMLAEDISALKAEQQVMLQREKALTRTLVREVHHRIKNHLQGLIGLLRVNAASRHSVQEAINDAIVQIQSIAIVHGLLAQDGENAIGFARLIERIVATMQLSAPIPLRCSIEAGNGEMLTVAEEEAVSLAIVIGELLTNAVKHTAITPQSHVEGRLTGGGDSVELTIVNGPARLPSGFSLDQSVNTGLDLVKALLPRNRSSLQIIQTGGEVMTRLQLRVATPASKLGQSEA